MTRVEECTSADTGVGAAMAAGSHAEKGIWALLVILAKIKIVIIKTNFLSLKKIKKFQEPNLTISAKQRSSPTSPSRFVKAVIIPALYDLSL